MKEDLRLRIQGSASLEARNRAREYLQARVLSSLQRSGAMIPLAFQGGTAYGSCIRSTGIPKTSTSLWNVQTGAMTSQRIFETFSPI